jgi:hypothetical protein
MFRASRTTVRYSPAIILNYRSEISHSLIGNPVKLAQTSTCSNRGDLYGNSVMETGGKARQMKV